MSMKASRDRLQKFGIDINDPVNGVFLPSSKNVARAARTRAIPHAIVHTKGYKRYVNNRIREAKTRADVIDVLDEIRAMLLSSDAKFIRVTKINWALFLRFLRRAWPFGPEHPPQPHNQQNKHTPRNRNIT